MKIIGVAPKDYPFIICIIDYLHQVFQCLYYNLNNAWTSFVKLEKQRIKDRTLKVVGGT